jgi:STE24 endopeptidase
LLNLPLSYYGGFVLPHRFGLSTSSRRDWALDRVKMALVGGALGLFVVQALYLALTAWPRTWWLPVGLGYWLFSAGLTALAPLLIAPLFFKFTPLSVEHQALAERLTALAEQAGTHVQGVFRFDMSRRTKAANAALTGLGNTRRILLGDTLLDEFTADEVETVIAHELGHHVHRDIPLGILVSAMIALAGLYLASLALQWGTAAFGFDGPADIAALPLFALTLGAFGLITLPLNNAYSRWREARADRYALEATRKPEAFANAMTRLANQNLADADPEAWAVLLLHSHPPIRDRVAMARAMAHTSNTDSLQTA